MDIILFHVYCCVGHELLLTLLCCDYSSYGGLIHAISTYSSGNGTKMHNLTECATKRCTIGLDVLQRCSVLNLEIDL